MNPKVSIIMGSTSDLPILNKAATFLNDMKVPFEMIARLPKWKNSPARQKSAESK